MQDAQALANSIGIAALVPLVIQMLKNSRLKGLGWIDHSTVLVSRLLSFAAAAATAAGMVITYQDTTLTIVNLTLGTVAAFAWELAKQAGLQEVVYRAAVKPASQP